MRPNELTHAIIGAAIEMHRELGPGKPEAAYERALARELTLRGLAIRVQKPVPVVYKGVKPDLLKDEAQAIMTGRIDSSGVFTANELLLKCPTK